MRSKILAVSTTLALGTGLGGLAFAAVRDTGVTPSAVPAGTASPVSDDPCRTPTAVDPQCVTLVKVPIPASSTHASSTPAPSTPAPSARPVASRTRGGGRTTLPGSVPSRTRAGGDDDGDHRGGRRDGSAEDSSRRGGADDSRSDDGGADDGTADQGPGDR